MSHCCCDRQPHRERGEVLAERERSVSPPSAARRRSTIVEDEGPGIDPRDLPHIFDRFYRGEAHSRRVRGSGLGLAIVKGFVEACGGTVRVESGPGGTRFIVTVPAAAPARVVT
jgi:signal transduction histidine kinase